MIAAKEHIWIIGASAGIGRALAQQLAEQGHALALSARDESALTNLRDQLPGQGHLVVRLDVGQYQSVRAGKQQILTHWRHINRVVFMAGIYRPMRMGELNIDETRKILQINLLGAFHVAEAVLPELSAQQKGALAFCASVAGYRGLPNSQPYGATKAGLINMVESLKAEYGDRIDIKLINPGFVKTRLTDRNDFYMPMRISVEQAAKEIIKGLNSGRFEIHFPKRFTWAVKFVTRLPYWLYYRLLRSK